VVSEFVISQALDVFAIYEDEPVEGRHRAFR